MNLFSCFRVYFGFLQASLFFLLCQQQRFDPFIFILPAFYLFYSFSRLPFIYILNGRKKMHTNLYTMVLMATTMMNKCTLASLVVFFCFFCFRLFFPFSFFIFLFSRVIFFFVYAQCMHKIQPNNMYTQKNCSNQNIQFYFPWIVWSSSSPKCWKQKILNDEFLVDDDGFFRALSIMMIMTLMYTMKTNI